LSFYFNRLIPLGIYSSHPPQNSETSKYQNTKLSKFTRRKVNTPSPPLQNFAQKINESSQNDRNKIENFETSKYYNKKPSKVHKKKGKYPFSSLVKLHTKN
jgi:hypothetical protein